MKRVLSEQLARAMVVEKVAAERKRQNELKAQGKFTYTAADEVSSVLKLPILLEEVGEVAKALNEGDDLASLQAELVQVAAVAVAWAESLEQEMEAAQ
jgi:NTP pyrophosphatase (non-canonical NTP hydrolase)